MKKLIISLSILTLIFILLYSSFYTVKENEFIIITEFGKTIGKPIKKAGLYYKLPYQKVNRINKQINIFTTQPIQLMLKDKNPVIVTCYVCWKINEPYTFFQSIFNQKIAIQKLNDLITNNLASTLGIYNIENIININIKKVKLLNIENKILTASNNLAQNRYGIEIVELGIKRLNYPQIVAESVYNRMKAEREKEAKKYRAEGSEAASKIEAQTDKEVSDILAKAYKQSEIIKGEGDKKSIEIYANAYSKDPDFFEFIKSLETYSKIFKKKTTLILSTKSELLKYLNSLNQNNKGN